MAMVDRQVLRELKDELEDRLGFTINEELIAQLFTYSDTYHAASDWGELDEEQSQESARFFVERLTGIRPSAELSAKELSVLYKRAAKAQPKLVKALRAEAKKAK